MLFDTFANKIKKLGFFQSHYNHAFYLDYNGTYVVVYVDDLQIVGPNFYCINCFKINLALRLKIIDLGPTFYDLGMKVVQENDTITVIQTVFIN